MRARDGRSTRARPAEWTSDDDALVHVLEGEAEITVLTEEGELRWD